MPITKTYRTVLNTRPLMFQEMRLVAERKRNGHNKEQICAEVLQKNLFQLRSKDRSVRFFREIWRRLGEADDFLLDVIIDYEAEQARLATFFLVLKVDDLLAEFMRDVWLDKYLRADYHLTAFDFRRFFAVKAEQSEQVASWSEETIIRLIRSYQSIMYQTGFVTRKGVPTELIAPLLHPQVEAYFRQHESERLADVLLGGIKR